MVSTQPPAAETERPKRKFSPGAFFLNVGLVIVNVFAIGALTGTISPVTAAVVGLGAQVVGTVAFFVTYWLGNKDPNG